MPSTGPESGPGRSLLRVAAGCLQRVDGAVLICQRPPHKIYPGEWEFPGGKIEPGETAEQALRRELGEELSIVASDCEPLMRLRHHYPELSVELEVWRVGRWSGTIQSSEHPDLAWVAPARLHRYPLLAANRPIVTALRLPGDYAFTPPNAALEPILAGLPGLPRGALLRLRLPGTDDLEYARLAAALRPACEHLGLGLMLDRDPALSRELNCGWHARAGLLPDLCRRPEGIERWFGASCHDLGELADARRLGADLVVLGPVHATETHPGADVLGWARFEALAVEAGAPVYAIGGLGPGHRMQAVARGARGVCGISAYWGRVSGGGTAASSSSAMV